MANHFRKTLRDKAVSLLTGLDTTGSNVFSGRVSPVKPAEMPALVVVPGDEDGSYDGGANGPSNLRLWQLVVFAEAVGNDGLYDALDQIAAEVEAALFGATHENLDGLAITIDPPRTEFRLGDMEARSNNRHGQLRMSFPVRYRTPLADPTVQA